MPKCSEARPAILAPTSDLASIRFRPELAAGFVPPHGSCAAAWRILIERSPAPTDPPQFLGVSSSLCAFAVIVIQPSPLLAGEPAIDVDAVLDGRQGFAPVLLVAKEGLITRPGLELEY